MKIIDATGTESRELIAEIRRAFATVQRGVGVSLHEADVIDDYGSAEDRAAARKLDTDRHWWEVPDRVLEQFDCSGGGFSFMDVRGFHYYVPAYMTYYLRRGEEPDWLVSHLQSPLHDWKTIEEIFDPAQRRVVARFLIHSLGSYYLSEAGRALEFGWGKSLPDTFFEARVRDCLGTPPNGALIYFWIWLAATLTRDIRPLLAIASESPAHIVALYAARQTLPPAFGPGQRFWKLSTEAHQAFNSWLTEPVIGDVLFRTYGIQPPGS